MAVEPGGGVLLGGHEILANDLPIVVRFDADDILDPTWGTSGAGYTTFAPSGVGTMAEVEGIELLPDGGIVLSGYTYGRWAWVAKLRSNGMLDTDFGVAGTGIVSVDMGSGADVARGDLVVDGATGDIYWLGTRNAVTTVLRFGRDGVQHTSSSLRPWGDATGRAQHQVPGTFNEEPYAGFVDSQGRVVLVGAVNAWTSDPSGFYVMRFTTAGVNELFEYHNRPFGGSRAASLDGGSIVVRADDSFCSSGWGQPTSATRRYYVACFNADGTLDGLATFASASSSYATLDGGLAAYDGQLVMGAGDHPWVETIRMGTDGDTIPDIGEQPGFGTPDGAFGACLESHGGGVVPAWGVTACSVGSATGWNSIAARSSDAGSKIAESSSAVTDVRLRFGINAPGDAIGTYHAPITFELVGS